MSHRRLAGLGPLSVVARQGAAENPKGAGRCGFGGALGGPLTVLLTQRQAQAPAAARRWGAVGCATLERGRTSDMNFLQIGRISLLSVALNIMTCLSCGVCLKMDCTSPRMSAIAAASQQLAECTERQDFMVVIVLMETT